MSRLPPAPGSRRERFCRGPRGRGRERRRGGGGQQRGQSHGEGRRGRGARVRDGSLVAVASLKGPGAALHLAEAADGVEDDGGPVDAQLRQVQVGGHLAVQVSPDPVLYVRGKSSRLGSKV